MSGIYDDVFIQEHIDDDDAAPRRTPGGPQQDPEAEEISKTSASRTLADDIVDAVQGVKRQPTRERRCACGSTEFRSIRPFGGGTASLRCLKCRELIPLASVQSRDARMQPSSRQVSQGPYRRAPQLPIDRNQPSFRIASEIQNDDPTT